MVVRLVVATIRALPIVITTSHQNWQNRTGSRRLGPVLANGAVLSGLPSKGKASRSGSDFVLFMATAGDHPFRSQERVPNSKDVTTLVLHAVPAWTQSSNPIGRLV